MGMNYEYSFINGKKVSSFGQSIVEIFKFFFCGVTYWTPYILRSYFLIHTQINESIYFIKDTSIRVGSSLFITLNLSIWLSNKRYLHNCNFLFINTNRGIGGKGTRIESERSFVYFNFVIQRYGKNNKRVVIKFKTKRILELK
jgi:hypothetical protein